MFGLSLSEDMNYFYRNTIILNIMFHAPIGRFQLELKTYRKCRENDERPIGKNTTI